MLAPLNGPFKSEKLAPGGRNTWTGFVEDEPINSSIFDHQMLEFEKKGSVLDPSGQKMINKAQSYSKGLEIMEFEDFEKEETEQQHNEQIENQRENPVLNSNNETITSLEDVVNLDLQSEISSPNIKRKKLATQDASNVSSFLGTWLDLSQRPRGPTREENQKIKEEKRAEAQIKIINKVEEKSVWHGSDKDTSQYLGRSWISPSKGLINMAASRIEVNDALVEPELLKLFKSDSEPTDRPSKFVSSHNIAKKFTPAQSNYIPKKTTHTWNDSQKGVSSIRFIPNYGHLLLSASLDSSIRIYETSNKHRCLMTYKGHSKAVRSIDWNPSGTQFLSSSFDRVVRLWDAETGITINKYEVPAIPYAAKFYPIDPNVFLVAQSNRRIIQWDSRIGEVTQEYNRHLGAVNTITWIDDSRRFVTTSDDKSIRIWEYNIPVDIKYIADPQMHSMPAVTLHPNKKWYLCQGLDNKIHVYSTTGKFRANPKKKFFGHSVSGYACNLSVSPDGRCVTSGDSTGNIFFWDWKTSRILKKISSAHSKVLIDVQWHPLQASRIATAGWDNVVKIWD